MGADNCCREQIKSKIVAITISAPPSSISAPGQAGGVIVAPTSSYESFDFKLTFKTTNWWDAYGRVAKF